MKTLLHIWNTFKYAFVLFVLVVIIGFAESRQYEKPITDVIITVDNQFENYFIDQSDVMALINGTEHNYVFNNSVGTISLKELERRVEVHQFVDEAQVFVDFEGHLSVDVKQNRPIARVINPDGPDYYIGTKGNILPESAHYTARVMMIRLRNHNWMSEYNIKDARGGEEILELLHYIHYNEFWSAQISAIEIKRNMEIVLYPQVSKQLVEFGTATEIDRKFRKLKTFYKKILPYKGWNTYETVNLKFKDQIICN